MPSWDLGIVMRFAGPWVKRAFDDTAHALKAYVEGAWCSGYLVKNFKALWLKSKRRCISRTEPQFLSIKSKVDELVVMLRATLSSLKARQWAISARPQR